MPTWCERFRCSQVCNITPQVQFGFRLTAFVQNSFVVSTPLATIASEVLRSLVFSERLSRLPPIRMLIVPKRNLRAWIVEILGLQRRRNYRRNSNDNPTRSPICFFGRCLRKKDLEPIALSPYVSASGGDRNRTCTSKGH